MDVPDGARAFTGIKEWLARFSRRAAYSTRIFGYHEHSRITECKNFADLALRLLACVVSPARVRD